MMRSLAIAVLCAGATAAYADVDETSALSLAAEAQEDFVAGRYVEACPKLETSLRIKHDLRPHGLLAACYEKLGKLATAWRTFKDLRKRAEAANEIDIASAAAVHVARLEPQLARLTIAVTAPVEGLTVTLAGRTLLANELGVASEIDAGTYKIVATAPGQPVWQQEIGVRDGKQERVDIPKLAPAPMPERIEIRKPPPPPPPPQSRRKLIGIAAAGAGGVVVITGVVLGLSARSKFDDARTQFGCDDDGRCPDQQGVDAVDSANGRANLATGVLLGGAAIAATGVVLILTAPKREHTVAPVAGRNAVGVILQGRF